MSLSCVDRPKSFNNNSDHLTKSDIAKYVER